MGIAANEKPFVYPLSTKASAKSPKTLDDSFQNFSGKFCKGEVNTFSTAFTPQSAMIFTMWYSCVGCFFIGLANYVCYMKIKEKEMKMKNHNHCYFVFCFIAAYREYIKEGEIY